MKVSDDLRRLGFVPTLGTRERTGLVRNVEVEVKAGTPLTYNFSGSAVVVYDEEGRPWGKYLRECRRIMSEIEEMVEGYELKLDPTAHVPHAEDGGYFFDQVAPRLRQAGAA